MSNTLELQTQDVFSGTQASSLIRALDLVASGLGLVLLAPFFVIIGLLVKLTSLGPVFYRAQRVGKDERLFRLYKFRSMYLDADRQGSAITVLDDPRVTPLGRFLRRTKLDELPQLINVFRGEMSLVGPRPEATCYVALYTPEQRQLLRARPGITSPASLLYRREEALLCGDNWETIYRGRILPAKLALDLDYVRQRTVWTDLVIILKTIMGLFRTPA
jgi:lipopolysaccharide/colanic/teichoic acid biosynthesis glycosyltransferase